MTTPFRCHRCAYLLQPAEGFQGTFLRCPKCGSDTSLPGTEPDPGYEYAQPFKPCPHCGQDLPVKAILCNRCGYNFKTGRRITERRTCPPFFRRWDGALPLRLALAGVLLPLCLPVLLWQNVAAAALVLIVWTVVLLGTAGTFPTVSLRRDQHGRCTLHTRQWVAFLPLVSRTRRLDRHTMRLEPDVEGGGVAAWVDLLLGDRIWLRLCLTPAVAFLYLYAMLAVGTHVLTLADDRGSRVERIRIYRCRRESKMREVADTICEVAGLSYS
jgi:hypothetical protein